jgi:antitoxin CptB
VISETLEKRRRRLKYRSQHCGTKELDLVLGRFSADRLDDLDPDQIGRFEALLDLPSPLVYAWVTRQEDPPLEMDNDVLRLLREFTLPS